jgi:hypothetical protein
MTRDGDGPHEKQWLALAPWGPAVRALWEWELGSRSARPTKEDFRPRVKANRRTTLPGDSTRFPARHA